MTTQKIVLVFLFMAAHNAAAIFFEDCGSYLTLEELHVEGCADDAAACELYINSTTRISFSIKTGVLNDYNDNLVASAFVYIRGIKFVITVTPDDPCEVLNCPLSDNKQTAYNATILLGDIFSPVRGNLNWMLDTKNSNEEDFHLLCFTFPTVIKNPPIE